MFDFKYAEFIIPAFVITGVVFAGLTWFTLSRARHWKKRFEELSDQSPK
ncbi:heme exporter protein CcmD [Phenylobacterium sp.]